jgi:hypothetical protein
MGIDLAAITDHLQRSLHAPCQGSHRDGKDWAVERPQPQVIKGWLNEIRGCPMYKAHVDDQPHSLLAEQVIITRAGRRPDPQILCDLRKIHLQILSRSLFGKRYPL